MEYPTAAYSPFSVPYDYSSITHFGPKVYSTNGQDTITPKQIGVVIGEAKGLSELDIKKINNMYCMGSLGMMIRSCYDGSVSKHLIYLLIEALILRMNIIFIVCGCKRRNCW